MAIDALLRHRDAVAVVPALVVLAMLATVSVKQLVKLKDESEPITISLYEEPQPVAEPPPPPPMARQWTPLQPAANPQPQARLEPVDARPVEAVAPREALAPPPVQRVPAPPLAPAQSPPPQPTSRPQPASASAETSYVAQLRTYLNAIKRYPTSREARLQRPQGKVRVWLELARDGVLRAAGVEETSGSMILDGAALATVRQGNYPAFPAETWAGRDQHRFAVTLEYSLES